MGNNPETVKTSPEQNKGFEEVQKEGAERSAELRQERERQVGEKLPDNLETARHEAFEKAVTIERVNTEAEQEQRLASPAERRNGPFSKAKSAASFYTTMSAAQTQMSAPSRAFSKIIHNKTVEKVSDVAASTVARPNAILSGAVFAFILTLGVYLVAKNLGYLLSGFETIGAFVLGWVLGIVYDFLKVMITGRK